MFETNHRRRRHRHRNATQQIPRSYLQHTMRITPKYSQSYSDIRLILVRHAERMDTVYGDDWYKEVFGNSPNAPPEVYRNSKLPRHLPQRNPSFHYILDPPITREGQRKSHHYGQELAKYYGPVDACFSSPSSRCVLTADALAAGMNTTRVPIAIETFLFEPLNWNTGLLAFPEVQACMSRGAWIKAGYNINRNYHRLGYALPGDDDEFSYAQRSKKFFRNLEQMFSYPVGRRGGQPRTILVVGHASTPVIFSMMVSGVPFDVKTFNEQRLVSEFLDTVVIERDAATRQWYQTY